MFQKLQTMKKNKKKGFTLIELIVVIAILAILAMLAVPQYQNLRDESAKSVAKANARSVYSAAMAADAVGEKVDANSVAKFAGGDIDPGDISASGSGDTIEVTWKGEINGKMYQAKCTKAGTDKDVTVTEKETSGE